MGAYLTRATKRKTDEFRQGGLTKAVMSAPANRVQPQFDSLRLDTVQGAGQECETGFVTSSGGDSCGLNSADDFLRFLWPVSHGAGKLAEVGYPPRALTSSWFRWYGCTVEFALQQPGRILSR